jgi:uncharacterized membrane protein (UPF0182 family)
MPPADDAPRRLPRRRFEGRGRVVLITAAVLAVVLITSLRGIASFWTDYLWFDSLGQGGVFTGRLVAQFTLVVMFTGTFFVLQFANLLIADRVAPAFRAPGPEEEVVERYRELVGSRTGLVRFSVAALFALVVGAGTSGQWQSWVLFRNAVDFGQTDPLFDRDVGFYVFQLPFLSFAIGWLFAALVIVLMLTTVAHYLNGGIRLQVPGPERVTPQVKVHLSVLLGLLAVVRAGDYYLERFELTVSTRGAVDGATYTDVKAQLPATNLLILIALSAAVLFLLNTRRKGWALPTMAISVWAVVAVVGGAIVPAAVQRIRVEPAESSREREFIERNIAATRTAFGLDQVEEVGFEGDQALTGDDLLANADSIRNIRLWDTGTLANTYQSLQGLRAGYSISDVDVDRYVVDGELTQLMIAARELETSALPQTSWEARHLTFTHGYGIVASPANSKEANGRPDLVVSEVPLEDELDLGIEQPGIYIGEGQSGYVITGTGRPEVDFVSDEATEFTEYDGADGVDVGSFARRFAFALRFGDVNPLFSGNLRDNSRIHYQRDVRERVSELAPFLTFDADPYPVVVGGRIQWVVDGYTTSSRFPYSQRGVVDGNNDLDRRFNYIRNSVKAVVDAYDGTVTLYVVDQDDPIIRAYMAAFPDLFTTEAAPEELAAHFRYPEDLFRVQTNMWGRYRITDPDDFFNGNGGWVVSRDPGAPDDAEPVAAADDTVDPNAAITTDNRIEPYYLLTALPGEEEESFVMLRPFTPLQLSGADRRSVLTGFLVASSDPDDYGRLISYRTPPSNQVDGPAIVAGTIRSFEAVSEDQTDLCREESGSTCTFGNLVFVPIEQGIIYVQPLYIQAEGGNFPVLRKVIVEFNGEVGYADTLREALLQLFDEVPETLEDDASPAPDPDPDEPDDPAGPADPEEPTSDATAAELLDRADELFVEADAALAESDLATYAEKIDEARALIQQAQALLAEDGGPGSGTADGDPDGTTPASAPTTTSTTEPQSA